MTGVAICENCLVRGPDRRLRVLAASVLMGILLIPGLAPMAHAEEGSRVIHFPAGRTLGVLKVQDVGTPRTHGAFAWYNSGMWDDWEFYGQAQGDVEIPAGKRVRLDLCRAAIRDLSPLSELRRNDLHTLSTGYTRATDAAMPHIAHLTGLECLDLTGSKITDDGVRHLSDLRRLEHLYLPGGITARGLMTLAPLQALKVLALQETDVTTAGLSAIAQLTSLEEFCCFRCGVYARGLRHLATLPRLRELLLTDSDIDDAGLIHISMLPSVKVLDLRMNKVSDSGLTTLAGMTQLESLNLMQSSVTDEGLARLKPLRNLKRLDLGRTEIGDAGVAHLAELPALEHLDLGSGPVTDAGLARLGRCHGLTFLWVGTNSKSAITDVGLGHLAKLRLLRALHIGGTGITDQGLVHLSRMQSLRTLSIPVSSGLTNEGMVILARMRPLTELSLRFLHGGQLTVAGMTHLNALTNLSRLTVQGAAPDGSTLDLSALVNLNWLVLSVRDPASPRGVFAYSDGDLACLAGLTKLRTLLLGPSSRLTDAGMAHLAGLDRLTRISIGGKGVTDAGLQYLTGKPAMDSLTLEGSFTAEGLRQLEELKALGNLKIRPEDQLRLTTIAWFKDALPALRYVNGARCE